MAATGFALADGHALWWVVLGLLLLRVFMAGDGKMLFICIVACLVLAARSWQWQRSLQEDVATCQTETPQHFLIYADRMNVDGNLMKCDAVWVERGERLKLTAFLKSEEQQRRLRSADRSFVVESRADISEVSGPTNENEFDYREYCRSQNVFLSAFISDWGKCTVTVSEKTSGAVLLLHDLRRRAALFLSSLPEPLDWYATVLLLGMKTDDFSGFCERIREMGLLYVFCLSGMHVFYLVEFLSVLLQKLGFDYETGQLASLFVLPCFIIVGGGSPSLVRAVMMNVISIGSALVFRRRVTPLMSWSLVLGASLLIYPRLLAGFGAQLSYLLTLVIILQRGEGTLAANVKVNLFSLPVILYQTYQWNLLTWLFSLLIMPVFEWLILPATLVGALIRVPLVTDVCAGILSGVSGFLTLLAKIPANVTFGRPPLFFVLLMLFMAALTETDRNGRRLWAVTAVSYGLMFLVIRCPLSSEVVYFDIGQGDCTLIRSAFNREVILIDTGGRVSFNTQKWQERSSRTSGETIVANYLESKGISRIDTLYLTHQDADHTANFPSISRKIDIRQVVVPKGMEKLESFRRRLAGSAVPPDRVIGVTAGSPGGADDLKLLHPFAEGQGTNEDSLVLWYDFHGVRCIFTGDLPQDGEREVIARYPELTADVMKTGHHGSRTATSPEFVQKLKPKVAIISCGRNNRYGHPNRETLETLDNARVPYLITADCGMIGLRRSMFGKAPYLWEYSGSSAPGSSGR